MRCGERECAASLGTELAPDLFQIFRIAQDALGDIENDAARLRDVHHALAVANEDLHAKLFFEQADLLADPRLGGIERGCGFRQIEAPARDLLQVTQLL